MSLIPGTGQGQKLSPTEIYQIAVKAGFSATDAVTATAIAMAESGGQTNIRSDIKINGQPTYAAGLWQLYTGSSASQTLDYQQAMADPLTNARAAYAKFVSSQKAGATGWCPWASFDEGTCAGQANRANTWRSFLGMAQAAATGVDIGQGDGQLVVPGGSDRSGADTTTAASGSSVATTVSTGGGGAQRNITLLDWGPFQVNLPTGIAWSALFGLGAIALLLIGIFLAFRPQLQGAAGAAVAAAGV